MLICSSGLKLSKPEAEERKMLLKKTLTDYRQGAIGALMDEYERAMFELKSILQTVSEQNYARIADSETENEDCRSIQTIMNHVVRSGYGYANLIREPVSMKTTAVENKQIAPGEIANEIDGMLAYTIEIYDQKREMLDDEMLDNTFVHPRRNVPYSIDQELEHAIVHVLRHRRQIDKFLLKFEI